MSPTDLDEFLQGLGVMDRPIDTLLHEYDPAKAREYYLRTRELKGRAVAAGKAASKASKSITVKPTVKAKTSSDSDRLKKIAEQRVAALKTRLDKLEKLISELVKQAKARTGADAPSSDASGSKSSTGAKSSSDRKPLTAAQKREAAKKAKERREKDGDQSLSAQAKALDDKIEKAQDRIKKLKAQIAEARK
jgi:hypothetical protein